MGWGDELMAAGEAQQASITHGAPVAILDNKGQPRWHEAWEHCPFLQRPEQYRPGDAAISNAGWCRPYIDYTGFSKSGPTWKWKPYRPIPAKVVLPPELLAWGRENAAGAVVIEPTIKSNAPSNKQWWGWGEMVAQRRDVPWLQIGPVKTMAGIRHLHTPSFAHAMAVLSAASAAVLPEGGLHHAAAAVGLPAVVLFGGFISPDITGYDSHINIFTGATACGNRRPCQHCVDAMQDIKPAQVIAALDTITRKAA
jgi:hypothetical protein